jgi:hypothetical protein
MTLREALRHSEIFRRTAAKSSAKDDFTTSECMAKFDDAKVSDFRGRVIIL